MTGGPHRDPARALAERQVEIEAMAEQVWFQIGRVDHDVQELRAVYDAADAPLGPSRGQRWVAFAMGMGVGVLASLVTVNWGPTLLGL